MKTILVNTPKEAVARAREYFKANPTEKYVLADGDATMGGLYYFVNGPILLSRSEKGIYLGCRSVEEGIALLEAVEA